MICLFFVEGVEETIWIAGKTIFDFVERHPALDVVLVLHKPGIYAMAKRILGWSETYKYEPDAKWFWCPVFYGLYPILIT